MAESLADLWARVQAQLEGARELLTNPDDEALYLYRDFLGQNELGLALDVLVDVALAQRAPDDAWRAFAGAAATMQLRVDDEVHGSTVQRILERLEAAQDWRGLQRLLNEWDPVGVRPELGGPDDEYSCMYVPLMERLSSGAPSSEVAAFLRADLSGHFGLDPDYSQPEAFAERLAAWYAADRR